MLSLLSTVEAMAMEATAGTMASALVMLSLLSTVEAMAMGATAMEIPTLVATGVAMELLKGTVAPLEVRVAR